MNAGSEAAATANGVTLHADTEIIDTDSLYDPDANTGDFVAPVSGWYFVSAIVDWDPSSLGNRHWLSRSFVESDARHRYASTLTARTP